MPQTIIYDDGSIILYSQIEFTLPKKKKNSYIINIVPKLIMNESYLVLDKNSYQ